MARKERDYYEILGIPRDADQKAIKDAYHRLAMKWHPDRSKAPDAEARFKEIAKAYAILSDPDKRAQYDARGFEGVAHYSADDLFRNIDLGSLFGDLGFGFGPGGDNVFDRFFRQSRREPSRGEDLRTSLDVPLERIAHGGSETLSFTRPVTCPHCHGHGTRDGRPQPTCPTCGGSGQQILRSSKGRESAGIFSFQQITTCPDCRGRGTRPTATCSQCGGGGQINQLETLKVQIPRGIEEGMTLRIGGHGLPPSTPGGLPGNLYVTVYAAPDARFQRRGADLWRSESLQIEEAVLGTKRLISTLDGQVEVTIPGGVQPDEVLRLRGKGLPHYQSEEHGNLNIRLQIQIPKRLSDRERALYEELRKLHHKG